jgi:hypothetical protein
MALHNYGATACVAAMCSDLSCWFIRLSTDTTPLLYILIKEEEEEE